MEIVLALGSAIAYGVADFGGGVLSKKAHVFTVILLSQPTASLVVLAVLPFWDGVFSWPALEWGAAAGVAGMAGVAFLYRGLAIGRMGVVAPITAVLAAAIPVSFGLATGERPGAIALMGVTAGLLAVVLIARTPAPVDPQRPASGLVEPSGRMPRGFPQAMGAGVGFGVFFILLERAPDGSGVWPLVGTRLSIVPAVDVEGIHALMAEFYSAKPRHGGEKGHDAEGQAGAMARKGSDRIPQPARAGHRKARHGQDRARP
jgi:hypothetical protein